MDSINKLIQLFEDFPGIGPRQAKRFVYFLLTKNNSFIDELSQEIRNLKKDISICPICQRFFAKNKNDKKECSICTSVNRDKKTLLIVARDVDLEHIEKTHSFNGMYFVLGGTVPILSKEPEKRIRLKELENIIKSMKISGLEEIILAMSLNPEGENTVDYLKKIIEEILNDSKIKISTLGRGLSTGTELEYSDNDTLKNALQNRH